MTITPATNATGWAELINAQPVQAVYTMFDYYFWGYSIAILFFVFQTMLLIKTKNITLSFVTGVFFVSLYASSIFVKAASVQIMFLMLVFELAGILYFLIWK